MWRKGPNQGLPLTIVFDLMKEDMPLVRTDKQLNSVLVQLWQKLKLEQQFQKLPPKKGPHMNQNKVTPSAPLSAALSWEEPEQLD